MPENERDTPNTSSTPGIGQGYALFQLAKALTAAEVQPADPAAQARAQQRIANWIAVLKGILSGSVAVGSRTPLEGVPTWATLKVVTGGFATGELLAAGPLQAHEQALLAKLPPTPERDARRTLNGYYLTDAGLAELQRRLQSGCYEVNVPEEGALLVVAWLAQNGHPESARELVATLGPFFQQLRFYPLPTEQPRQSGARVYLETAGKVVERLKQIKPNLRILAQKEAVCVRTPLYDQMVRLFLETVEGEPPSYECDAGGRWARAENGRFPVQGGWPCQHYPADWAERAARVLRECDAAAAEPKPGESPKRAADNFALLQGYLRRCVEAPASLQGKDVGRIRLILAGYLTKRGTPDSARCRALREQQAKHAGAPIYHAIAQALVPRLKAYPPNDGLENSGAITQPITADEAEHWRLPAGTGIPKTIQQKIERCVKAAIPVLAERGLITSGEVLARVLPQITADITAASLTDPALRHLYAAIYAAFRQRRSLLLLNLEKQVRLSELPWIAAIDPFRGDTLSAKQLALQTLAEVTRLAIVSFPYAILPNKLLQELRALAKTAGVDLPLVEEVAVDIFMGEFSGKFLEAAKQAGKLLDNTLYTTYYGIDYGAVRQMPAEPATPRSWFSSAPRSSFVRLCATRAGVELGRWHPATNGMIVEQQQILTSQNLAVLFANLQLDSALRDQLDGLARRSFTWICQRQQMKVARRHARLIQIKNTAYAWRQMMFYLALLPQPTLAEFLRWAEEHLSHQTEVFQKQFRPAWLGLVLAAEGQPLDSQAATQAGAKRFLGWTNTEHWLMAEA